MSKLISTLSAGDIIKLNENGQPKQFIFLEHDHYGEGEVTLIRKNVFCSRAWNADYSYGYNDYNGSPADMFCNSQYINNLDLIIQNCLINVPLFSTQGVVSGSTVNRGTINTLYRKSFLLSSPEVQISSSSVEGTIFDYFASNELLICYYDDNTTPAWWWLRSPKISDNYSAYCINSSGEIKDSSAKTGFSGFRPALCLSSEILVSDTVDDDGCYNIEYVPAAEQYQKVDGVWLRMV